MIQEALKYANDVFNQYTKNKFGLDDSIVITNRLINPDGSIPQENENKIILSLVHIEQDNNKQFYNRSQKTSTNNYARQSPSEYYNLYLLITANFDDYQESLKFINTALKFFQSHQILDINTNSNLPKGLTKIEFCLEKDTGYMQMQNLWTALGAKYQPSVTYKMRLISVISDEVDKFDASIQQITNNQTS